MSLGSLVTFDKLDAAAQQLIREGLQARTFSYSPYSKFAVGSALRCADGSIRTGCNVENASFSASICAERCALTKAISEGQQDFHSISVVANSIDGRLTTPCGVCRQMLCEFGDFPVYVTDPGMKDVLVTTTHELLPYAFRKGSKNNFISDNAS
ncbi:cytidine deaminase [Nasonia vitripennis]|uniref:Cytidine deaminase n=1 Tax=Nasonia vitripennis TaxID=7425 RepID=A0A7M7IQ35_NASVI|nr:cytidine deaminase [Nasonia vitripennis]